MDTLFFFLEHAVSPKNMGLALFFDIIASVLAAGIVQKTIEFSTIKHAVVAFCLSMTLFILLYFVFKDQVNDYREKTISQFFYDLTQSGATPQEGHCEDIAGWKAGLECIERNPREESYYLRTADLLENENDKHAAMILLECSLDFVDGAPIAICHRLQRYYEELKPEKRPVLRDCEKIMELP